MKTEKEVQEVISQVEKEVQAICSKYGVVVECTDDKLFITHHQKHENGDWSLRGREVPGFAPF